MKKTLLCCFLGTISLLHAQNATWTGASSSNWNLDANWNPSIPTGQANFNLASGGSVNVDGETTIGNIRFGNGGIWTFSGSTLTISNAAANSGDRPLGIYNTNVSVVFENEVQFTSSAATNYSQIGLNNTNGTLDFAGGIRGNSEISGFALRTASSSTVSETIIRGAISDIALLEWNIPNSTLDLRASSSVSEQTLISANNITLKLGHDSALGTGVLQLNHSSTAGATITLQATGTSRSYGNAITFNGGWDNSNVGVYSISGDHDLTFGGLATLNRDVNIAVAAERRFELAGNTSGSKNLTKNGEGIMVLSGASIAHTGNTSVFAGTLIINGTITAAGTPTVSANSGGVLGGIGHILRHVSIGSEGGLNPGDPASGGIGTLTIGNISNARSLSFISDSQITFELQSALVHDQVVIFGNLTLDGILNINDLGVTEPGEFLLFTYTGSLTDNGLEWGATPSGWELSLNTATSGEVWLQVAVIPEPSSAWLLLLSSFLIPRRKFRLAQV